MIPLFAPRSWDALFGARRAVWLGHTSGLQRRSAPKSARENWGSYFSPHPYVPQCTAVARGVCRSSIHCTASVEVFRGVRRREGVHWAGFLDGLHVAQRNTPVGMLEREFQQVHESG